MKTINTTVAAKSTATKAYPVKDVTIKIKEYKRVKPVTEEAVTELFKSVPREDFLDAQDIAEIGTYFTVGKQVQSWMSKSNIDPNLKLAI